MGRNKKMEREEMERENKRKRKKKDWLKKIRWFKRKGRKC